MVKILTVAILIVIGSALTQKLDAQPFNADSIKNWQLKGYAKSAENQQDMYSALVLYQHLFQRFPDNINYLRKMAVYQYKTAEYEKAFQSFYKLDSLKKGKSVDARFYMALLLKHQGKYQQALNELKAIKKNQKTGKLKSRLENEITGCELAIATADSLAQVKVERLNNTINHKHIEFNPFNLSETVMIYGSSCIDTVLYYGKHEMKPKRRFFSAEFRNGIWMAADDVPEPFRMDNDTDMGDGTFSNDKKRFYFTVTKKNKQNETRSHIYVREWINDHWTKPVILGEEINHKNYSSSQPTVGTCFDPSVEILYFVSDRTGGYGQSDIWYSTYDIRTKTYQKAINAGIFINTSGNELTPHFDVAQHRLYFSSDGWPGLGGLDIFYAEGDLFMWNEPVNMLSPLNSSHDDLYFTTSDFKDDGFFTSNRTGSKTLAGNIPSDDIYYWNTASSQKVWIKGKIVGSEYELAQQTKPMDTIQSADENTSLGEASVNLFLRKDTSNNIFMSKIKTDEEGNFKFLATKGKDYILKINDTRVLEKELVIESKTVSLSDSNEISLKPMEVKTMSRKPIRLENIYYEFNKAELTDKSKNALDSTLVLFLRQYKDISIEIASHTDDVGDERFNIRLSQKRASNVVKYLVKNGIEIHRLKAVGFGEAQNIAPNTHPDGSDNPEGRALNRRTEFRLIEAVYQQ